MIRSYIYICNICSFPFKPVSFVTAERQELLFYGFCCYICTSQSKPTRHNRIAHPPAGRLAKRNVMERYKIQEQQQDRTTTSRNHKRTSASNSLIAAAKNMICNISFQFALICCSVVATEFTLAATAVMRALHTTIMALLIEKEQK